MQTQLVKVHQFTMEVCPDTQTVNRISTNRSHSKVTRTPVTNDRLFNKALVAYGQLTHKPVRTFNGHGYIQVFDRVINISNGNQVTDSNIVGLF